MKEVVELAFKVVTYLLNLILSPLNSAISKYLPAVDVAFDYVNNFFTYIINFSGFVMSYFNVPTIFLEFVVGYFTFKLTVPFIVYFIKLAIRWYDTFQ